MKPGALPLTREQLLMAFRHLARPGWPDTLEEALAHPLWGTCIRGYASTFNRPPFMQRGAARAHSLPTAAVPPTPTAPPVKASRPGGRPQTGWFDAKKAAANDRDDRDDRDDRNE